MIWLLLSDRLLRDLFRSGMRPQRTSDGNLTQNVAAPDVQCRANRACRGKISHMTLRSMRVRSSFVEVIYHLRFMFTVGRNQQNHYATKPFRPTTSSTPRILQGWYEWGYFAIEDGARNGDGLGKGFAGHSGVQQGCINNSQDELCAFGRISRPLPACTSQPRPTACAEQAVEALRDTGFAGKCARFHAHLVLPVKSNVTPCTWRKSTGTVWSQTGRDNTARNPLTWVAHLVQGFLWRDNTGAESQLVDSFHCRLHPRENKTPDGRKL